MELLISLITILFLIGAISFLRPSKKMKALSVVRMSASKEGFKIGSTNELRKKF
jgi:glycerol-3-phosphate acyltransferase PlsY